MKRKICIVTSTRADYGLLKNTMKVMKKNEKMKMLLIVAGTHLTEEFGKTIEEIRKDGFRVDKKVELTMSSDSKSAISISFGIGVIGFSNAYMEMRPDLVLLLGDRYEILSAACAATLQNIPIGHIHGGELTKGAIDEVMRHAITKMSHIHFTACSEYMERVIQMGENREMVINVGGLGIDAIKNMNLLTKKEIERLYPYLVRKDYLIVTMHPETNGNNESGEEQVGRLLKALENCGEKAILFTYPNADAKGRGIIKSINEASKKNKNMHIIKSMGQLHYLSLCNYSCGVIGNSSSGILEVPYLKTPVINIGKRQEGRIKPDGVIDCENDIKAIEDALVKIQNSEFNSTLSSKERSNPYGEGGAADKIVSELEARLEIDCIKQFFDIN